MIKKIIIWGTKDKGIRVLQNINPSEAVVIAFTDSTQTYIDSIHDGIRLLPFYTAIEENFDYIVIASSFYSEITVFLEMHGINNNKIIQIFNASLAIPNTLFYFDQIDLNQEKTKIFLSLDALLLGDF